MGRADSNYRVQDIVSHLAPTRGKLSFEGKKYLFFSSVLLSTWSFSFSLVDFKRFINDGFARELLMPSYDNNYGNRWVKNLHCYFFKSYIHIYTYILIRMQPKIDSFLSLSLSLCFFSRSVRFVRFFRSLSSIYLIRFFFGIVRQIDRGFHLGIGTDLRHIPLTFQHSRWNYHSCVSLYILYIFFFLFLLYVYWMACFNVCMHVVLFKMREI